MAKLILSFKGHLLSIHHLDEEPTTIGRIGECRIRIDSLAIAPRHAEVVPSEDGYLILSLDPDYPLQLNNERVDQASLHHGDLIQIGKHTLVFSENSPGLAPARATTHAEIAANTQIDEPDEVAEEIATDSVTGYMQVQNGVLIGRVIVFRHALTQLKRAGTDGVVVTRKGSSYKLVRLKDQVRVKIDGIPLEEEDVEVPLRNKNLVEIDNVRFQFFTGTADETSGTDGKD